MNDKLEKIAKKDGRYSPQAFKFVYAGLGHTVKKKANEPNHVSGETLCKELQKLAIERWGRLAMLVLNTWGVKTTQDFGEIVYLMIENKWMSAQPKDSIEDFNDIYNFETAFKKQFKF